MLHPSFKEMIEKMNESAGEDNKKITSRYSLVIAAAKRARQVNAGSSPLVETEPKAKNLSVAVDELYAGKVRILEEPEYEEETYYDETSFHGEFADVDYSEDGDEDYEDGDENPDEDGSEEEEEDSDE